MAMPRVQNGISTRDSFRRGKTRFHRTRHVPALSTPEAAALVMGVIEARLRDGWSLQQIGWHRFCRDTAVVQVVTQQFEHRTTIKEEI
jgi:hypothetical protein